jgi:hypothetical protein
MRRTLRCLPLAVALGTLGMAAACSRAGRADPAAPAEPSPGAPVITFTNQGLDQVQVYAVRPGGDLRRLTTVASGRSETLTLPRDLTFSAGPVTIIAVPLASNRAASTGPITIRPGDRLTITMPPTQNSLMVLPAPPQ